MSTIATSFFGGFMKKSYPDYEVEVQTFAHDGFTPVTIYVDINFVQDETADGIRGSQLFWTYDILKIKAWMTVRGHTIDYTHALDKDHYADIHEACVEAVRSFERESA
jgi:hypothetical protein